jgi:hypothetical protein
MIIKKWPENFVPGLRTNFHYFDESYITPLPGGIWVVQGAITDKLDSTFRSCAVSASADPGVFVGSFRKSMTQDKTDCPLNFINGMNLKKQNSNPIIYNPSQFWVEYKASECVACEDYKVFKIDHDHPRDRVLRAMFGSSGHLFGIISADNSYRVLEIPFGDSDKDVFFGCVSTDGLSALIVSVSEFAIIDNPLI